jgi:hypothetical protein
MRPRLSHVVGTVSAVALSLGLVGGVLAVTPAGAIDQSHECAATHCNTAPTVGAYPVIAPMLGGSVPEAVALGQTFTAGATGNLTGVQVYVSTFDAAVPATFTVQIESTAAGKPSGTILATTDVSTSGIAGTPVWATASFATSVPVTKSTVYAITLKQIPSVATGQRWLSWELDSDQVAAYPDYVGGSAFAYAAGGGGWTEGGSAFYDTSGAKTDFAFRTYLAVTPTPTPTATPSPTARPSVVPTEPPTSTVTPAPSSSDRGLATLALLAAVGLGALLLVTRPARRRR